MPVIIIWKRMGWLVPVLGLLGPLLAEAAMEAFWGYEVRLIDQCLAAAVGSLLIYYTGTWLNAPERLAVREYEAPRHHNITGALGTTHSYVEPRVSFT